MKIQIAMEMEFLIMQVMVISVPIDYNENMELTKRLGELQFTI